MQATKRNTIVAAFVLTGTVIALAGCGGGSKASPPPPPSNPAAVLASLSPANIIAGGRDFTLTVNGANFTSSATVVWNTSPVPTSFVSSQQLTATIPASFIVSAGFASVGAYNATSTESNQLKFRTNNPAPQITSVSPDRAMAGAAPLILTATGSSFVSGATLLLNGSPRPITSQSATQLSAAIPASDLAAAQSLAVTVVNPDPAVGPSNQIAFTVTSLTSNPTPTLTSALDCPS
jgi:IPT/TIG domain